MTIRQRLLANMAITLSVLTACFGFMSWGMYRYSQLQEHSEALNNSVERWLKLDFQVSQYLKYSLEAILSGEKVTQERVLQSVNEIVHGFIEVERITQKLSEYQTESQFEAQDQKQVEIRNQFGLINAELEKSMVELRAGDKAGALKHISASVMHARLDKKFIELIQVEVTTNEALEKEIEGALARLQKDLIFFFGLLVVACMTLSSFFMFHIYRSIQRSITYAKDALLRGTQSLGAGNLQTEIKIESRDELSVVSEAFNKMAKDLSTAWNTISLQQQQLLSSSKLSALGEMAGGIAHEINNPLAAIKNLAGQLQEVVDDAELDKPLLKQMAAQVESTTDRITKIVSGLRSFSRDGSRDVFRVVNVHQLIDETLSLCSERFKNHGTFIEVDAFDETLAFEGRAVEVSQVLLNLLNNAYDAVSSLKEKWIRLSVRVSAENQIQIRVMDCGSGIPRDIQEKIFQPFFTTKEIGKGVGMGLSIALGIIKGHHGELSLDQQCPNTCFVISLPITQTKAITAA